MDDLGALRAAVIREPGEDTPRLMYADCLDERNGPRDVLRAAYIRKAVELAAWKRNGRFRTHSDPTHKHIEIAVNGEGVSAWEFYQTGMKLRNELNALWNEEVYHHPDCLHVGGRYLKVEYDRGFVSELTCRVQEFGEYLAGSLLWDGTGECPRTAHPVAKVRIEDPVPRSVADEWGARFPLVEFVCTYAPEKRLVVEVSCPGNGTQFNHLMEAAEPIRAGENVTTNGKLGQCVVARDGAAVLGVAVGDSYTV